MKTMTEQETFIDIYSFVRDHLSMYTPDEIMSAIRLHWQYGTIDVIYRGDKIIACVRWNISPDGRICDVLDYVVKPGENGFRLAKHFIARNWSRFPSVRYIRFFRNRKYPNKESRMYSIAKLLKLRSKLDER